jgi:hypothetical protein
MHDERQIDISRQLNSLVDVIYGLVIVEGAVAYSSLFTRVGEFENASRWMPVVLALILTYFTTIQSFVDYHLASETQPYRLRSSEKRGLDLWRFYLDIVIVGSYSFVLLKCHVLLEDPASEIPFAFAALPAIFLLYIVWGWLRRSTSDNGNPYSEILLWCCVAAYGVVAFAYLQVIDLVGASPLTNSIFLAIALAVMVVYRCINWGQNESV